MNVTGMGDLCFPRTYADKLGYQLSATANIKMEIRKIGSGVTFRRLNLSKTKRTLSCFSMTVSVPVSPHAPDELIPFSSIPCNGPVGGEQGCSEGI